MTIELGEKVATVGSGTQQGEQKSIKQFFKASDLTPGQVIEGVYKGTFESKKTEGYHFHIFEDKLGDVYAYGDSVAWKDVVSAIKTKQEESSNLLYAQLKYEGKFNNKADKKKTTHRFSPVELFATNLPKVTAQVATEGTVTGEEIPF